MNTGIFAGNIAAAVAACLFGASVVATRVAVQDIPPLSLAVYRFGQGGLLLVLVLFIEARGLLQIARRDALFIALLGAILFALFPVMFNMSLRWTEASRGSLMLATAPLWSAWLAQATRKEHLVPRQIGGVLVTVMGVALVLTERGLTWQANAWALAGDGLMLLGAFCGAVYAVLAKRALTRYSALTVTTYAMVFGTLFLVPFTFGEGLYRVLAQLEGRMVFLLIFLGVFGGALGYFLMTYSLKRLTPTQTVVYVNLNPMVATLLGAFLLAEQLTHVFLIGFAAVIGGVLLVNWPRKIHG
jgi:drug/metabolite transporter (DMT)-like permease